MNTFFAEDQIPKMILGYEIIIVHENGPKFETACYLLDNDICTLPYKRIEFLDEC